MIATEATTGIWHAPYARVSIGAIALVFLAATSALAVTTIMPVVSTELRGDGLYAVAFSATLAASVVGMVAVGAWSDRRGPAGPLIAAVALFVAGLLLAGAAASMPLLVVGRLVQGLGSGGLTVALYVVVARVYPPVLHGRVFAAFSAAWVVPSLVGPFLAGAVAEYLHWRWVFFGLALLAVAAFLLLAGRLPGLGAQEADAVTQGGPRRVAVRIAAAGVVAVALIALGLAGEADALAATVIAAALVAVVVCVRPLMPRGTLRSGRGLASVVLLRGVLAAAFFSAEVYVPFFFIDRHGFSPVWAGLALTFAAVTWAIASDLQSRLWRDVANTRITTISVFLLTVSLAIVLLASLTVAPPVVMIAAWAVAAAGMGLAYPRLSVLTLASSGADDRGANSAALSIADAVGAAAAIAVLGLVFTALDPAVAFGGVFAVAALIAACALLPARRVTPSI